MAWDEYFDFIPEPHESILFKGLRFPILIVLEEYLKGRTAEQLDEQFSYALTPEQIRLAIRYFEEERESVSAYMARSNAKYHERRASFEARRPSLLRDRLAEWNAKYGEEAEREGVSVIELVRRHEPDSLPNKVPA